MRSRLAVAVVLACGVLAGLYLACSEKEPTARLASGKKTSGNQIATPLIASPVANKAGSLIVFTILCKDANGEVITSLDLPGGRQPAEPQVAVINAAGQQVYQCTLSYG